MGNSKHVTAKPQHKGYIHQTHQNQKGKKQVVTQQPPVDPNQVPQGPPQGPVQGPPTDPQAPPLAQQTPSPTRRMGQMTGQPQW